MTTVELIKSIAFDFGWTVSTDEEEDTVVFDFRYYTKHGLDYGFCAELTGNKFGGFLGDVERYCEDFDPDLKPIGGLAMTGTASVVHLTISRTLWMRWKRRKDFSQIFITH